MSKLFKLSERSEDWSTIAVAGSGGTPPGSGDDPPTRALFFYGPALPAWRIREGVAKDAVTSAVRPGDCRARACDRNDLPTTAAEADAAPPGAGRIPRWIGTRVVGAHCGFGYTPSGHAETELGDLDRRVGAMLADGVALSAIAAALAARPDQAPWGAGSSCASNAAGRGVTPGEFDAFLRELRRRGCIDICRLGRERAVLCGRLMHRPVYGYRHHPRNRGVHVFAPEEAGVVRGIFLLAEAGLSPVAIAAILTSKGYPSPAGEGSRAGGGPFEGGRWTARHVRTILRRPLYIGLNVLGRGRRRGGAFHPRLVVGDVAHLRIVSANEVPGATAAILVALLRGLCERWLC